MKAGEVCNREVVIIECDQTILEAAKLMRQYHVGDVVVIEKRNGENVPVGILTDRDIVLKILAKDLAPAEIQVGDAMSFDLLIALEQDEIIDIVKRMRAGGIRRIPVVNDRGGLEGIIAVDDLVDLFAELMADLVALISTQRRHEQEKRS